MTTQSISQRFLNDLDILINKLNESNIEQINEGRFFDSMKKRIKSFLEINKKYITEKLPELLRYIKNSALSGDNKKAIFLFIAMTLMSLSVDMGAVKNIYKENNIDTKIEMLNSPKENNNLDVSMLKSSFNLGEYDYTEADIDRFYDEIKKQLPETDGGVTLKGTVVVTISDDPSNPSNRNFANDDTPEQKAKGGTLLEKRLTSVKEFVEELRFKLFDNNINCELKVIGVVYKDRIFSIKNLSYVLDNTATGNVDGKTIEQPTDNSNMLVPNITGGIKDIKGLSRNYQFVELLKLGGINAKRFNGDKISNGDKYSEWIVDTRKHIKEFLTRLQKNYPDYNIYFDKTVRAISPISGSMAGVSNVDRQYSVVPEKFIMRFDSFLLENRKTDNEKYNKWIKIFGSKFPELTIKQAEAFNNNIKEVLHYLEQMYGNSILDFKVIEPEA